MSTGPRYGQPVVGLARLSKTSNSSFSNGISTASQSVQVLSVLACERGRSTEPISLLRVVPGPQVSCSPRKLGRARASPPGNIAREDPLPRGDAAFVLKYSYTPGTFVLFGCLIAPNLNANIQMVHWASVAQSLIYWKRKQISMSAPGQGQGGSGDAPGGQNNQGATTTSTQLVSTATSSATSSATLSSTATSSSSATTSSTSTGSSSIDGEQTMIIGIVVGGVGALLLVSLLVICCIQRRKKKRASKKQKGAEPVSYTGLNSAFAGVPFRDSQHSSLSPRPLLLSNSNTAYHGVPSPGQRASETEGFLYRSNRDTDSPQHSPQHSPQPSPRYSPSHPYVPAQSHTRSLTHSRTDSDTSVLTLNDPSEAHVLSANGPFNPQVVEPPRFQEPQARDTMGFPMEHAAALEEIRLQTMTPVLLSPQPRHPLQHQDSLERVVRDGMSAPSPAPSNSAPGRLRVLSQDYPRESPVLGLQNPVIIQNPAIKILGGGLGRNDSQRTVSSMSSMGPIIGDEELENLGVGARPQPLRFRKP